jgi:DNA-binding NtrC family response regulator
MLPASGGPPAFRRVLVFEETERLRTVAAMSLRRAGYDVDEAPDEETADRLASQRVRDYAVLVVGLDERGGGAGARVASRAQAARPALSIVAWSDGPRPEFARRVSWLARSWMPDDLLAAVMHACGDQAPRAAVREPRRRTNP